MLQFGVGQVHLAPIKLLHSLQELTGVDPDNFLDALDKSKNYILIEYILIEMQINKSCFI